MLPRWHVFFGAIFTLIIWYVAPNTNWIYLLLVFLSSFLIDFDHYMASVMETKRWSLKSSFDYHKMMNKIEMEEKKKGIKKRSDFHLFHTIEFHALVGILGIFWIPLSYVFIGMVFHSMLDVFSLMNKGLMYRREYFFFNWLAKKVS